MSGVGVGVSRLSDGMIVDRAQHVGFSLLTHTSIHTPRSYLRTAELERLCKAIAAFGKGVPVAPKEGAVKGVSVPPAVRALLEALCDEG